MKILVIGQNPSIEENLIIPFYGTPSMNRIKWLFGYRVRYCYFINASNKFGKVRRKDYEFNNLKEVLENSRFDGVITLGTYARQYLEQSRVEFKQVLNLPHPSPLNRYWNSVVNENQVKRNLNKFFDSLSK